jgi:CelD/BcsL family acetyltransferase involved in cellulose biosynthesis
MTALRARWDELANGPRHTIFQNFTWNQLAARIFAAEQPPFVVMAESDSGAAIIPACIDLRCRRVSLLGEELFDYRQPLCVGEESMLHSAWQAIVDFASDNNLGFGFHSVRGEEEPLPATSIFPLNTFTSAPCIHAHRVSDFAHPSLARKLRQLLQRGVQWKRHKGSESVLVQHIYQLKANEPGSLFSVPSRVQMLVAVAQASADSCEIFTLEHERLLVAALITFRDGDWRRFYTTYFHRPWAHYSPGMSLLAEVVRQSLAAGLHCDLMTGDHAYKRRLTTAGTPLFKVEISADALAPAHHLAQPA